MLSYQATSKSKGSIKTFSLDITRDDDVQRVVREVIALEGKIDVLVNNAGVICAGE